MRALVKRTRPLRRFSRNEDESAARCVPLTLRDLVSFGADEDYDRTYLTRASEGEGVFV
jgi:hypothetical protein